MAENIYIGARYVIQYYGNWDMAVQYEPLSAVLYNSSAYVSRKPVPAGTLPTDTEFWAFWGSGNAVIDALSQRVSQLEQRTDNIETRLVGAESDILGLSSRLGLAEGNIDSLFAEQNSQSILIGDLQNETASLRSAVDALTADVALCERRSNRNAENGYMGLTSGFGARPVQYASPIVLTVNRTTSQTVTGNTSTIVGFNNTLLQNPVNQNYVYRNSNGTFNMVNSFQPAGYTYDVWISGCVLCVPSGGTGNKQIYVGVNNNILYASEAYCPTSASRVTLTIPEIYIGALQGTTDIFGIYLINWAAGDVVGLGSISGSNYGSTWCNIKAYPRY